MRMSGFSWFAPAAAAAGHPTDALFVGQSHSIVDNLVALLSHSRAWNCSAETASYAGDRPASGRIPVLSGHGLTRSILLYMTRTGPSDLVRPAETFTSTVRAWQRAALAVEGWPQITVSIPDRRRHWVSKWDQFPESLHRDCQVWLDRLAGNNLLEDAPFRPVRPATLAHREWQIRAFASAVMRMGRDPATLTCLADLVEMETFKTGLRFFLDREGGPTTAIADLASVLKAVARHHVGAEPERLNRMGSIIRKRLASGRVGLTETNRTRLRPFDDRGSI